MSQALNEASLLDMLYQLIVEISGKPATLTPDTELLTVGVNSIGMVQLAAQCEERFGFDFDPEDLTIDKLATPGLMARLLIGKYRIHELAG